MGSTESMLKEHYNTCIMYVLLNATHILYKAGDNFLILKLYHNYTENFNTIYFYTYFQFYLMTKRLHGK